MKLSYHFTIQRTFHPSSNRLIIPSSNGHISSIKLSYHITIKWPYFISHQIIISSHQMTIFHPSSNYIIPFTIFHQSSNYHIISSDDHISSIIKLSFHPVVKRPHVVHLMAVVHPSCSSHYFIMVPLCHVRPRIFH